MSDRTPDGNSPTASGPPSESDRARAELQARIQKYIDQGLAQLGTASPRAELEVWGQRLLTWLALGLTEDQRGPTGGVRSPTRAVEEVLGAELFGSRRRGKRGGESAFPVLLDRFEWAARQAGWLEQRHTESGETLHFGNAELPALLVSQHWASSRQISADYALPDNIGGYGAWAEAVSIAIQAGGPIGPWLERLHNETNPRLLRERIAVTCGAIGGLPMGTPVTPALREAFHLATAALIWFAPAWREHNRRLGPHQDYREHPSPWFFDDRLYLNCISWLARGSQAVVGEFGLPSVPALWENPPVPLAKLVALGRFQMRLSMREARAVVALSLPAFGQSQGLWDADFWDEFYADQRRLAACMGFGDGYMFRSRWLRYHAAPLLRQADRLHELVHAVEQSLNVAAILLARDEELSGLVYSEWVERLTRDPSDRLAKIWAMMVRPFQQSAQPQIRERLFEDAPQRLRQAQLWEVARAALREHFQVSAAPWPSSASLSDAGYLDRLSVWLKWTRLCEFSAQDWEQRLARNAHVAPDRWHALLEAGAPPQQVAALVVEGWSSRSPEFAGFWNYEPQMIRAFLEAVPPDLLRGLAPLAKLPDGFFEPLAKLLPGLWLERLADDSLPWPVDVRLRLLRWFFLYSASIEVRDRCAIALAKADGGGSHA